MVNFGIAGKNNRWVFKHNNSPSCDILDAVSYNDTCLLHWSVAVLMCIADYYLKVWRNTNFHWYGKTW